MVSKYYCHGLVVDTEEGFDKELVTRYGIYVIDQATRRQTIHEKMKISC